MSYPLSHFALLSALLAIASASDVAHHRIANALTVALALAGVAAQAAVHGGRGAAGAVGGIVIVGALLWPAWSHRMVGGGDLKLGAAAAAWVGLERLPAYLLAAAIAAGVLSLVAFGASSLRARSEMRRNLVAVALGAAPTRVSLAAEHGRAPVPAGAALAVGALFAILTGGTP
ncbi:MULTISPECIES: prepilin peptidase [unclassified Anaeromyxobacter]|uniref:prepilin peptidase n=1 Tax=unclassified Anaeromyxobacter TaxID=2620896 RepID=UPI001F5709B0|nr:MULTISPECIES: prepilin peptidase [unclassified Anaeromyxobacter]